MEIIRIISIFDKVNDSLVKEIDVNFITIEELRSIFNPSSDDPDMHFVYDISPAAAEKISTYIKEPFDFVNYIYQLDCFSGET